MPNPRWERNYFDEFRELIQRLFMEADRRRRLDKLDLLVAIHSAMPSSQLSTLITQLKEEIETKMSQLDDAISALTTKVAANTDAEESAIVLIQGIPAMIQAAIDKAIAAGATPAQLQALTDLGTTLDTEAQKLGAAVVANTPAA